MVLKVSCTRCHTLKGLLSGDGEEPTLQGRTVEGLSPASSVCMHGSLQEPGFSRGTQCLDKGQQRREHREMFTRKAGQGILHDESWDGPRKTLTAPSQ